MCSLPTRTLAGALGRSNVVKTWDTVPGSEYANEFGVANTRILHFQASSHYRFGSKSNVQHRDAHLSSGEVTGIDLCEMSRRR